MVDYDNDDFESEGETDKKKQMQKEPIVSSTQPLKTSDDHLEYNAIQDNKSQDPLTQPLHEKEPFKEPSYEKEQEQEPEHEKEQEQEHEPPDIPSVKATPHSRELPRTKKSIDIPPKREISRTGEKSKRSIVVESKNVTPLDKISIEIQKSREKYKKLFANSLADSLPTEERKITYLENQNKVLTHEFKVLSGYLTTLIEIKNNDLYLKEGKAKAVPKHKIVPPKEKIERKSSKTELSTDRGKLNNLIQDYNKINERLQQVSNPEFFMLLKAREKEADTKTEQLKKRSKMMEIKQRQKDKDIAKTVQGGGKPEILEVMKKNQKELTILKEFVSDIDLKLDSINKKPEKYINSEKEKHNKRYNELLEECYSLDIDIKAADKREVKETPKTEALKKIKALKEKVETDMKNIESKQKLLQFEYSSRQKKLTEEQTNLQNKVNEIKDKNKDLVSTLNRQMEKAKNSHSPPNALIEQYIKENEKGNQEIIQKAFDLRLGILVAKIQRRWKLYLSKKTQKKQYDLSAQATKPTSTKNKALDSHKKSIDSEKPIKEEIKPTEPINTNPPIDEKTIVQQEEKPVELKPDFSKPAFKPKGKKFNFSKQVDPNANKSNVNMSQISNDADTNKLNPIAEPPIIKPSNEVPSQKPITPKQEPKLNPAISQKVENEELKDDINNNKFGNFSPKIEKIEKQKKEEPITIPSANNNQFNNFSPKIEKIEKPKKEEPVTIPSANNQFGNVSPKIEKIDKPKKEEPAVILPEKPNMIADPNQNIGAPSEVKTEEAKKPKKFNFAKKKKEESKLPSELNNDPIIPSVPYNDAPSLVNKDPLDDIPSSTKEPTKIQIKPDPKQYEPVIANKISSDPFADLDNYDPLEKYNKKKNEAKKLVNEVNKPVVEPQIMKAMNEEKPLYHQPEVYNAEVPVVNKSPEPLIVQAPSASKTEGLYDDLEVIPI